MYIQSHSEKCKKRLFISSLPLNFQIDFKLKLCKERKKISTSTKLKKEAFKVFLKVRNGNKLCRQQRRALQCITKRIDTLTCTSCSVCWCSSSRIGKVCSAVQCSRIRWITLQPYGWVESTNTLKQDCKLKLSQPNVTYVSNITMFEMEVNIPATSIENKVLPANIRIPPPVEARKIWK